MKGLFFSPNSPQSKKSLISESKSLDRISGLKSPLLETSPISPSLFSGKNYSSLSIKQPKNSESLPRIKLEDAKKASKLKEMLKNSSNLARFGEIGKRRKENAFRQGFRNFVSFGSHESIFGNSPTMLSISEKVKGDLIREEYKEYPEQLVTKQIKRSFLKSLLIEEKEENQQAEEANQGKLPNFGFLTEEKKHPEKKNEQKEERKESNEKNINGNKGCHAGEVKKRFSIFLFCY